MQITIQKKYIVAYEVAENIFAVFLVIVSFVFNIVVDIVEKTVREFTETVAKTRNYLQALFGFNIYSLKLARVRVLETRADSVKNSFKNNDFLIYSNLLAPPVL